MKLVHWVRFTWDLEQLPPLGSVLPEHYHFAAAIAADEKELRAVVTRSIAHDTSWGDAIHDVNGMIEGWLERAFATDGIGVYLALRHGLRIIGASVLMPDPAAEDHLTPGPCVLMEYRNRGFGSALLEESLRQLRAAGLTRASALTKSNAPVAKFLYPKFNGTLAPCDTPLVAA
jgi:ribosomal protein S18 acetylase RimI-like enzyme